MLLHTMYADISTSEMILFSLPVTARGILPWYSSVTSTGLIGSGGLDHTYAMNVFVHADEYCSMSLDESASCAFLFADKCMHNMAIHTSVSMTHAYD